MSQTYLFSDSPKSSPHWHHKGPLSREFRPNTQNLRITRVKKFLFHYSFLFGYGMITANLGESPFPGVKSSICELTSSLVTIDAIDWCPPTSVANKFYREFTRAVRLIRLSEVGSVVSENAYVRRSVPYSTPLPVSRVFGVCSGSPRIIMAEARWFLIIKILCYTSMHMRRLC